MRNIHYINANETELASAKGWASRHRSAIHLGLHQTTRVERVGRAYNNGMEHTHAIVQGINAWVAYAEAHKCRYETEIGEDYVLGPAWKDWGLGLRGLLNGESGQLDCGTLDSIIVTNIHEQFPDITF